MSRKDGRDYIYLIWKDPNTRRNYTVGQLSKNGQYEFSYGHEVEKAIEKGFKLLISFDDIHEIYKSDMLFPTFATRLPDRKRRGIENILKKYELTQYDEYRLLKRSGARLPIDNLEFIDPILEENGDIVKRIFYIAGSRYYIGCEGNDCDKAIGLKEGDSLKLVLEPENEHDRNAIVIMDLNDNRVGYLPRYYSEGMKNRIEQDVEYKCTVSEVNKDKMCHECIKVILEVYSKTKDKKIS